MVRLELAACLLLLVFAAAEEYVWVLDGLKKCRQAGEPCRRDYDCCGRKALCRVMPGEEGPFSMKFRCENDGKRFYY